MWKSEEGSRFEKRRWGREGECERGKEKGESQNDV